MMRALKNKLKNNKGQILVEYLLLMVIAIACATILTQKLISRGSSPGYVIKMWNKVILTIGNDLPDCANQTDFSKPNCPP